MTNTLTPLRVAALASVLALACLLSGAFALWCRAEESPAAADPSSDVAAPAAASDQEPAAPAKTQPKTKPGARGKAAAAAPVYIGAYSVDHEFQLIT
ncbi:MAG: hypothetical protein JXL80_11250, partial [Planctomycetes bacterium]|nr:hypothetical protein [Planctomycetota bacterium]